MLAIRAFALAVASVLAIPASAAVIPYESIGIGGPNNIYDIDLRMCTGPSGHCIDRNFGDCGLVANQSKMCQVRPVPAGRCVSGTTANSNGQNCQWNNAANIAHHFCTLAANNWIQCVTNADCPSGDTCNTASGAMPAQVAGCACTPANEQTICGPDVQARCSDGDPDIKFGDPGGVALCTQTILGATAAPTNCGSEGGSALTSARYPGFENAPSAVTPQRAPGGSLSTIGGFYDARTTYAYTITNKDATHGIRRFVGLGKSYWGDWFYADKSVSGGAVSAILPAMPFDAPGGWHTGLDIGTCTGGTLVPGTLCLNNTQCGGGTCGGQTGPWNFSVDEVGFIFTANVVGGAATCPPNCGTNYDRHTYETRAIEQVGASDSKAGVQLSFDSLEVAADGAAGTGDVVSVFQLWSIPILNNDARCFVGGDPARHVAAEIGRCSTASTGVPLPCDPATEDQGGGHNHCEASAVCRYCGGRFNAVSNPEALPGGYEDNLGVGECEPGFSCANANDLHGRMGGLNNVAYNLKVPLFLVFSSGRNRAEVRDTDDAGGCAAISGVDSCTLGHTSGASDGIGTGGTYASGFAFPAYSAAFGGPGSTCCNTGAAISWAPEDGGTLVGTPVETGDYGVGPNGIPGCIGDNQGGVGSPPCSTTGGGSPPGTTNPGGDDVEQNSGVDFGDGGAAGRNGVGPLRVGETGFGPAQAVPNPLAGDASAAGLPGSLTDPNGAPTWRSACSSSVIDLEVLGTDNNDSIFKISRLQCPVRSSGPDCWYSADGDAIDDTLDNCPTVNNPSQANADGDALGDDCDACPLDALNDVDGDTLCGDVDNCPKRSNPTAAPAAFNTATGGQIDSDGDGWGNQCDGDFQNAGSTIDNADFALFKSAFGANRTGFTCPDSGGPPVGDADTVNDDPCDEYDLNNLGGTIDNADLAVFKALFGKTKTANTDDVEKCPACPLACTGQCPPVNP